jgi:hypothetical protein
MSLKKELLVLVTGTSWGLLGFTRGLNSYDHTYKSKEYLYTSKVPHGLWGILLYMNPLLFPIIVYKEMYRLEVNLRGLDKEKKTDYYNHII